MSRTQDQFHRAGGEPSEDGWLIEIGGVASKERHVRSWCLNRIGYDGMQDQVVRCTLDDNWRRDGLKCIMRIDVKKPNVGKRLEYRYQTKLTLIGESTIFDEHLIQEYKDTLRCRRSISTKIAHFSL